MADSTQDFTRKILVDVEIKSEQVKKDIPILTDTLQNFTEEIEKLKKVQKDLEKVNDTSSQKYRDNNRAIVENMQSVRQLKAEIREANKYIDNAAKAINSETGSIQQNRAVLSLVTSDYIKLAQAEGQTDESTKKLAVDVNNLTDRLKEQEKEIGQTYRNVGNYTDSINKSSIATNKAAQGFKDLSGAVSSVRAGVGFLPQQFGGAFTALAGTIQGFSTGIKEYATVQYAAEQAAYKSALAEEVLAKATEEAAAANAAEVAGLVSKKEAQLANVAVTEAAAGAEAAAAASSEAAATEAMTVVGLGAAALGGVILALTGAIASYLGQFASYSDAVSAGWDMFIANIQSVLNTVANADFGNFAKNWRDAGDNAGYAAFRLKDLNRESEASAVLTADEDRQVGLILLKIRDKATTAVEGEKLYQEALKLTNDQYKRTSTIAQSAYINTVLAQTAGYNLTKDELKSLTDLSQGYETVLQNAKQLIELDKLPKDYLKNASAALQSVIQTDTKKDSADQRLKNRDDSKQAAADAKAKAAQAAADRLLQQEKAAYDESENLLRQSITKELQDIYEEYGDRALAASQSYDNELTKLKKFRDKKLITKQEYDKVEAQLTKQYNADIEKITKDFADKDYQRYLAADNQLRDLQIANIAEATTRTIAGLHQKNAAQNEVLDQQDAETQKTIDALNIELLNKNKQFSADELAEIKARIDAENLLLEINKQKKAQIAKETAEAVTRARAKAESDQQLTKDGRSVKDAKKTSNLFNDSGLKAAELKAVHDRYQFEIDENKRALAAIESDNTLSMAQKLEAEKALRGKIKEAESQEQDEIAAIQKAHLVAKVDFYAAAEQQVQGALMDLFSQSIQQQESAALASAEARKNGELNNASLTNTQKQLINAKYDKEERKIKLKAFKDNQKLQIANAIINGAVGVLKNIAELGFIPSIPANILTVALTAIEVGKIASQKPGFATGGQYVSDGRGAALPGYSTRDNINATLRDGEGVVVSEAMRVPWARNTISSINEQFGGRSFSVPGNYGLSMPAFASGGQFTDGGNANRYYSQPIINSGELANSIAYQLINNMPAIMVDVKDINTQQGILAQTLDRVNL